MIRIFLILILGAFLLLACNDKHSDTNTSKGGAVYVSPSIDKYGRFRKGHVRFPVSTKKDAYKNRMRSKYYYETRGRYRSKKK